MNRKGFTLIELLVTIAIVSLIAGISAYAIISSVNDSKERALAITSNNIKDAAKLYATEQNSESDWKDVTGYEYKYFCVTIQELINKGLLNSDDTLNKDYNFTGSTYVIVMKDKLTSVVEKEEITDDSSLDSYKICTGEIKNEEVTAPEVSGSNSYTDQIDLDFEDGTAESAREYECLYGLTSNNLDRTGTIDGNVCRMSGLDNNTNYYARVCMRTERESYICSETSSYKTKDFVSPTIDKVGKTGVMIKYDDSNVIGGANYYFKSSVDTISIGDVNRCDLNGDTFTCSGSTTTTIEANTWYKTDMENVDLEYEQENYIVTITARITDKSNNFKESSKNISIEKNLVTYTATFNLGLADTINGGKNNIKISCQAEEGKSCVPSSKAPTIVRNGYTSVGWSTSKSATSASLSSGGTITLSGNISYYPITYKRVTVTFDKNGASSIGSTSVSCNMYNSATSCSVKSPTITASSNTPNVVGWNTSKSAKTSSWNVGVNKSFSSNTTYYAITKSSSKTYTATFTVQDTNSASGSFGSTSCTIAETYNGAAPSSSCQITAPVLTGKNGYSAVGWNTNRNATVASVGSGGRAYLTGNTTYYSIVAKSAPSVPAPSLTINISSHGFNQTYTNSSGGTKSVNITCNSSSCTDIGSNSCTNSSCQGIGWSGKKPIISWSTNSLNTLNVYYDSQTHNQFDESRWGSYSTSTTGTMSVETGGYRIIRIVDTDGNSTVEVKIYLKLDYVAPIVTLPSSSSTAWRKDLWDIYYSDSLSGLSSSVNAFAEPTYISCSNSEARNNCGITNGFQSYGGSSGSKTTQCSAYYDCYSNYLELWSCATDNVGNKTCSKRVNPSGTQTNYTYLVKDY